MTAQDVEYSLRRAAGEKSQWGRFFRPITEYRVVDARTIVMRLDKPFTPMLNNLAMFSASILPAKLVESQGAAFFDKPVGSGPFMLTQWARGQKQTMVKNPHYWEAGKPRLDGVTDRDPPGGQLARPEAEGGRARRDHRHPVQPGRRR